MENNKARGTTKGSKAHRRVNVQAQGAARYKGRQGAKSNQKHMYVDIQEVARQVRRCDTRDDRSNRSLLPKLMNLETSSKTGYSSQLCVAEQLD